MRSQAEAVTKHINGEAASAFNAVCGLSDYDEIYGLFVGAGFPDVDAKSVSLTLTNENGAEFVANGIASTPVAGLIADLGRK